MTIDKNDRCDIPCPDNSFEICGGLHVDDRFVTVSEIGKYARNKIHNGNSECVKSQQFAEGQHREIIPYPEVKLIWPLKTNVY